MADTDEYGLTLKQRRFAERYIVDFDKEASAEEAGFSKDMVPALLTHPLVRAAIDALNKQRIDALKMTQEEAEIHLKAMAEPHFGDFYVQKDGKMVVKEDIPPEKLAAVKEVRTAKDGSQTLVLYNRDAVLDKIMRRHGAYAQIHKVEGHIDHDHHHKVDVPSLIMEMDHLLKTRPRVIDAEVVDDARLPRPEN